MGSVRNPAAAAWVSQSRFKWGARRPLTRDVRLACACRRSTLTSGSSLGVTLWDLFFVGLTIVVFAVLLLILRGIETFER